MDDSVDKCAQNPPYTSLHPKPFILSNNDIPSTTNKFGQPHRKLTSINPQSPHLSSSHHSNNILQSKEIIPADRISLHSSESLLAAEDKLLPVYGHTDSASETRHSISSTLDKGTKLQSSRIRLTEEHLPSEKSNKKRSAQDSLPGKIECEGLLSLASNLVEVSTDLSGLNSSKAGSALPLSSLQNNSPQQSTSQNQNPPSVPTAFAHRQDDELAPLGTLWMYLDNISRFNGSMEQAIQAYGEYKWDNLNV